MSRVAGFDVLSRWHLPACERRGAVAVEMYGDLVTIICHDAIVDIETLYGLPAGAPESMTHLETGVSDTVMLGSYRQGDSQCYLLDLLVSAGVKQDRKKVLERRDALQVIWERHLAPAAREVFSMPRVWSGGLMSAYDMVAAKGGGLWVCMPGESRAALCMRRER